MLMNCIRSHNIYLEPGFSAGAGLYLHRTLVRSNRYSTIIVNGKQVT